MKKKLFVSAFLLTFFLLSCSTIVFAQATYTVQILSNVKGANVYINNAFVGNIPLTIKLKAGSHLIRLSAPGYEDATKVINLSGNAIVNISMEPKKTPPPVKLYSLEIDSNVKGAKIFINDEDTKRVTPYVFELTAGIHIIKLTAPGYKDYEEKIMLNANMKKYYELERIIKQYSLNVAANVRGAKVFIDNIDQGTVPLNTVLNEGIYTVVVKAPGYYDYTTTVNLNRNTTINANLEVAKKYYKLTIMSNVRNAKVFINNSEQGITPFNTSLEEGVYTITVRAVDYNDYTTTVNLNKDTTLNAVLELAKKFHLLTVTANVRNALLSIEGVVEKRSLPFSMNLEEGRYTITVFAKGYKPYEVTVVLNKSTKIDAVLLPSNPQVQIIIPKEILNPDTRKPENRVKVFVNGKIQKDLRFEVTSGRHTIRVETGALVWEKVINFKDGFNYILNVVFDLEIKEVE